jgi:hypothetical protein
VLQVYDACQEIHYLWTAPIEAAAILTILAILVGKFALPGWGVIAAVLFLQYFFGWRVIKNKMANAANTNERGGIVQELLPAMKLVKYYAWEQFFEAKIQAVSELTCVGYTNDARGITYNLLLMEHTGFEDGTCGAMLATDPQA